MHCRKEDELKLKCLSNLLGISIQDKRELIKTNRSVEQVCKAINADSLKYLTLEDISDVVPEKSYNHCFSGYIDERILS